MEDDISELSHRLSAGSTAVQHADAKHSLVEGKEVVSATFSPHNMASLIYSLQSAALEAWSSFLNLSSDGILRHR